MNNQRAFRCTSGGGGDEPQTMWGRKQKQHFERNFADPDCLEGLWTLCLEVLKDSLEKLLLTDDYSWPWQQETGLEKHNFPAKGFDDLMSSKASDLFTQVQMKLRLPKT